jgi:hypothetical protein
VAGKASRKALTSSEEREEIKEIEAETARVNAALAMIDEEESKETQEREKKESEEEEREREEKERERKRDQEWESKFVYAADQVQPRPEAPANPEMYELVRKVQLQYARKDDQVTAQKEQTRELALQLKEVQENYRQVNTHTQHQPFKSPLFIAHYRKRAVGERESSAEV